MVGCLNRVIHLTGMDAYILARKDVVYTEIHPVTVIGNPVVTIGGENTVCMGSDYDGCDVVNGIRKMNDITNLYNLILKEFGEELTKKIFWKNAYNFFAERI